MNEQSPFELRAGMQLMQRLVLRDPDVAAVRQGLEETIAQAPALFCGALIALDLKLLQEREEIPDFAALAAVLREFGIIPAGVCNGAPAQTAAAQAANWAVLAEQRETAAKAPAPPSREPARVVTQPLRSGQQVHAPGDLILMAQVSAGAEVLAGGSIHVHAPLRGRALAGIRGDETAVIVCSALHAELVSIAGRYRTLDELQPELSGRPAHIHLDGEQLRIECV